jgi:hypothetical protein
MVLIVDPLKLMEHDGKLIQVSSTCNGGKLHEAIQAHVIVANRALELQHLPKIWWIVTDIMI